MRLLLDVASVVFLSTDAGQVTRATTLSYDTVPALCGTPFCQSVLGSVAVADGERCRIGPTVVGVGRPCLGPVPSPAPTPIASFPPFIAHPGTGCVASSRVAWPADTEADCAIACNASCAAFSFSAGGCLLYDECCSGYINASSTLFTDECTRAPTSAPTTDSPSAPLPTQAPTALPTHSPLAPDTPTLSPTQLPSSEPIVAPTISYRSYPCSFYSIDPEHGNCSYDVAGVCYTQQPPDRDPPQSNAFDKCPYGEWISGERRCVPPIDGPCWVTEVEGVGLSGELTLVQLGSDCSSQPNVAFGESDGLLATWHTRLHYVRKQSDWYRIALSGYGQLAVQVRSAPVISIGLTIPDVPAALHPVFTPDLPMYWSPGWSDKAYTTVSEGTTLLNVSFPVVSDLFIPTAVAIHYEFLYPPCV